MRINTVEIQNFRKLKSCKIDFSEKETIFVGANNSGKTTAMDALMTFLKTKNFRTQDFTLSNWKVLNKVSEKWTNKEVKDEESQLYLDVIRRNSARISTIITELLNSSRPSEIELSSTSIQELLQEVIDQAADSMQLKNVELVVNFPQQPFNVLADRSKLKIAFMNLVVNAIEAMEQVENAQLLLSLSSGDNQVVCEVTDNGCGIPADNLGRLFEPYYTSKRNGMGLGLASTMNIIQSHKGYIEVHSKPGKGTTFLVHLPIE